jgi:hypothetical protein
VVEIRLVVGYNRNEYIIKELSALKKKNADHTQKIAECERALEELGGHLSEYVWKQLYVKRV